MLEVSLDADPHLGHEFFTPVLFEVDRKWHALASNKHFHAFEPFTILHGLHCCLCPSSDCPPIFERFVAWVLNFIVYPVSLFSFSELLHDAALMLILCIFRVAYLLATNSKGDACIQSFVLLKSLRYFELGLICQDTSGSPSTC